MEHSAVKGALDVPSMNSLGSCHILLDWNSSQQAMMDIIPKYTHWIPSFEQKFLGPEIDLSEP